MPVAGSASAETSAAVRCAHPASCCHGGLGAYAEQPEPVPAHTVSDRRLPLASTLSVVPPTAVTNGLDDGHSTPNPLSPVDTVIGNCLLNTPSKSLSTNGISTEPHELFTSVAWVVAY